MLQCVLVGCSVSTHGGENLATSAGQGTLRKKERLKRDKDNDNVENLMMMNGDAPAPPAVPAAAAAARPVRQYLHVG